MPRPTFYLDPVTGSKFGRTMPEGIPTLLVGPAGPYTTGIAQAVQLIVYGRNAFADEYRYVLSDPFHILMLYTPLALFPDFQIVRGIWMLLAELALLVIVWLSFRLAEWEPPGWLLALLICSLRQFHCSMENPLKAGMVTPRKPGGFSMA